jgi:hypothetical protein
LSGKTDAYLAKYDNTGAFLSVLELGGLGSNDSDDTFGYSVSTSDSGFVYMTGMTRVNLGNNLAQGQLDLFIAKYLQ